MFTVYVELRADTSHVTKDAPLLITRHNAMGGDHERMAWHGRMTWEDGMGGWDGRMGWEDDMGGCHGRMAWEDCLGWEDDMGGWHGRKAWDGRMTWEDGNVWKGLFSLSVMNTMTMPTHSPELIGWANMNIESTTERNCRTVCIVANTRGPNAYGSKDPILIRAEEATIHAPNHRRPLSRF